MSPLQCYVTPHPPWTLIKGLGGKKRADKQEGEECRAEKAHIINHGRLADVRLLLNTGCRTAKWPQAWLNKELFPWAEWPLKAPTGRWRSSVGRSILPLLQLLISATKFSNHPTANPPLTTNSGFIVFNLHITTWSWRSQSVNSYILFVTMVLSFDMAY